MKKITKQIFSKFYYFLKNQSLLKEVLYPNSCLIVGSELIGNITLGEKVKIFYSSLHGNIDVGNYTSIWGPNIVIEGNINIGSYCSIARNVSFQESYHNYKRLSNYLIWKNVFNEYESNETISKGKISIGSDVWIGMNSSVLSAVSIGHGAVIGANTLVNSNVPPYSIVAGVPGKIIGYRFEKEIIKKLLQIKWWEWDQSKLLRNKKIFKNNLTLRDIEKLSNFN